MIYPIVAYGDPVLRKVAREIKPEEFTELAKLIGDMFETMHLASGIGLAAPQIGKDIRLFIVDGSTTDDPEIKEFRKVFVNAQKIEEEGEAWAFEEGCLSIPGIRENVSRPSQIRLRYQDENGDTHQEVFSGMQARVIQHEYDHIEGILFIDHLSALRRRLLKGKLTGISKGQASADYRMKFPVARR
jgi:peptide deformylase